MIGVNISGGEYGKYSGKYGSSYIYPSQNSLKYYAAQKMEVVRIPFDWERVQPRKNGALDTAELTRLDGVVNNAKALGLKVVLDPHNYGSAYGELIGAGTSNSSFADFWGKVAAHFKDDANVIFGLMNEPHKQKASQWIVSVNAAVDAIRDVGAKQKILVPGTYWDGAHSWVSSDNDTVIGKGVKDPLNNYAFEVHQYLDRDNSGTHRNVVSENIGVERIKAITTWAKGNDHELFMGEFGVASDSTSLKALDKMLAYMDQHDDVWMGATYWAAGPWWGDYMYSVEPKNGADKPQMAILRKYDLGSSGPLPKPSPAPAGKPAVPTPDATKDNQSSNSSGADKLRGTSGADTLSGGGGSDIYFVQSSGDRVVEAAGQGADTVNSYISYSLPSHVENLTLRGSTAQTGTGNSLDNLIIGNSGSNVLQGRGGNDILRGAEGHDQLTGGGGHDVFIFDAALHAARNVDTIVDFDASEDRILLDGSIFTNLGQEGMLPSSLFYKGVAARDRDDRIIYDSKKGTMLYDPDGSGSKEAIMFARLAEGLALANTDFLVM